MFIMELAGTDSFDIFTKSGRYAGMVVSKPDGTYRVRFDSNGSKGSARKFADKLVALEYIYQRRVKRGWSVA